MRVIETIPTPGANRGEAAFYDSTLLRLSDANADILNNNAGPVGPGNVTWAFEWDFTIAPGSSVGISKDEQVEPFPEPSAFSLFALGFLCWVFCRRKG
jgi:hypothetical protein